MFISEVLCFVLNKYGKLTRMQLKSMLHSFYSDDELNEAKDRLHGDASNLNVTDLPRHRTRAKGDNRAKLLAGDIIDLCTFIDEKGCLGSLPTYVARNLDRVPAVKAEDLELFCVAKKMEEMEKRLAAVESVNFENLMTRFDNVSARLNMQQDTIQRATNDLITQMDSATSQLNTPQSESLQVSGEVPVDSADNKKTSSWAEVAAAASSASADEEWTVVSRQKEKPASAPRLPVRVHGTKASESATIRSVPRKPVLVAYVGRLHADTTEEDLTKFLQGEGMVGIVCRKLKPKDGKIYKTSAFRVTCSLESSELLYDENCWPSGVELRDWVFK